MSSKPSQSATAVRTIVDRGIAVRNVAAHRESPAQFGPVGLGWPSALPNQESEAFGDRQQRSVHPP